ncbi:HIT family protein [Candidatus Kaiserbacteria bacterium]|nr:HIT family protein [Candidatus Kaiserbacteria bacterium]
MPDCIFCKITSGHVPAEVLYEDEKTISFLDIQPMNDGHALVIPKAHAADIFAIPEADWLAVTSTVHKVAQAVEKALSPDGLNIVMNNKSAGGQIVFHAHVHVIPRKEGDGHLKAARTYVLDPQDAPALGAKIRNALTQ